MQRRNPALHLQDCRDHWTKLNFYCFFEATQYGMCAHPVPDKDLFFSCKCSINKSESCYAHFLTTFTISKAVSLKNGHA